MKHQALLLGTAVALGCSCLPLVASAAEQEPEVSVEFRYFAPKIKGSVQGKDYYSQRIDQDKLDFKDDLGVDDAKAPEVRVQYGKWQADYIGFRSSEDQYRLKAPIRHKDHLYKGNLDTDMDMDYFALNWRQDVARDSMRQTYWLAGLRYIRMDATATGINANDKPQSDSDSASGVVPAVGFGGKWYTSPRVSLQAEVSGLPLGSHGYIADLEASASYHFSEQWGLSAGWRYLDLKLKKDDKTAEYRASGPFVGVAYTF